MEASKTANKKIAGIRNELRSFFETVGRNKVTEEQINADYTNALNEWDDEGSQENTIPPNITITINNPVNSSAPKRD